MYPKVSVIIPVYNKKQYLEECFNSISQQTEVNLEIIFINDGSTDGCEDILDEFEKVDKRVKVVSQKNQGVGNARNNGTNLATSPFVMFLDPDDFYPNEKAIETLIDLCEKSNSPIAGGTIEKFGEFSFHQGIEKSSSVITDFNELQNCYGFQRFIFRKEFLKKYDICFPSYSRFQDPPFLAKALTCAGQFPMTNLSTYGYRVGHYKLKWTRQKTLDFLSGVRDVLKVCSEAGLERLAKHLVQKINQRQVYYFLKPEDINILKVLRDSQEFIDRRNWGFIIKPLHDYRKSSYITWQFHRLKAFVKLIFF